MSSMVTTVDGNMSVQRVIYMLSFKGITEETARGLITDAMADGSAKVLRRSGWTLRYNDGHTMAGTFRITKRVQF